MPPGSSRPEGGLGRDAEKPQARSYHRLERRHGRSEVGLGSGGRQGRGSEERQRGLEVVPLQTGQSRLKGSMKGCGGVKSGYVLARGDSEKSQYCRPLLGFGG